MQRHLLEVNITLPRFGSINAIVNIIMGRCRPVGYLVTININGHILYITNIKNNRKPIANECLTSILLNSLINV